MVLSPARLVKTPIDGPYPHRMSDSAGLEWGLRINVVPGDADADGFEAIFGVTLFHILSKGHSYL